MGLEVFSTLLGSGIQGQMVGASHGRLTHGCSLGNGTLPNSSTPSLAGWLEGTVRTGPDVGQGLPAVPTVPPRCLSLSSAEPTCLPPWCWAPSTASPVWFWFLGSGSSRVSPCGRSRVARVGLQGFCGYSLRRSKILHAAGTSVVISAPRCQTPAPRPAELHPDTVAPSPCASHRRPCDPAVSPQGPSAPWGRLGCPSPAA